MSTDGRGRPTLADLAHELASGRQTARQLAEDCLQRIADPAGEGSRTFLKVHDAPARATAAAIDDRRRRQAAVAPFAGIPVSVKDLFDVAGDVTMAGSRALANVAPAQQDCPAVDRLRAAGMVVIGRTNMTEFAYSGLGINPHYGTPLNPWERAVGRIPGGSSSGAAVSVTDGMACCGLGTDTGGSCRIPAALTGLVGWKPTARRIPLQGVLPLSSSLDSVGCMAWTVNDCRVVDGILSAGEAPTTRAEKMPPSRLRLAVPDSLALDGSDRAVATAFERALTRLSAAGVTIAHVPLEELAEIPQLNAKGGFAAAEAHAWHRALLQRHGDLYDPRVKVRILRGCEQSAADYIDLLRLRADMIARVGRATEACDALVMPTVPVVAPRLTEVAGDAEYTRVNLLLLRNPSVANFLDGCAISLPMHEPGDAPTGLMLIGRHGTDLALLHIAATIEALLER
jgi:aspartyl-tRNA(Asn)/glutamyl-tRNA(Gln) amidotransferase subunit A